MLLLVFCQRLGNDWEDFECSLGKARLDSIYSQCPMFSQGIANHSSMYYQDIRLCSAISLVSINWCWAIIGRRPETMRYCRPLTSCMTDMKLGKRFIFCYIKLGGHPVGWTSVISVECAFTGTGCLFFCYCHGYTLCFPLVLTGLALGTPMQQQMAPQCMYAQPLRPKPDTIQHHLLGLNWHKYRDQLK